MAGGFVNSSRRNPCSVCGKDHGCRIFEDGKVWCLRVTGESVVPYGYRLIGLLRGGLGGSVVPATSDWSPGEEMRRRKWKEENQQRRAEYRNSLSISERDRAIRLLAREVPLNEEDRKYLAEVRGLSDRQIERGLYFSVSPQQKLPDGIPRNFPGASMSGKRLCNYHRGIGGALFDSSGRAIGIQVRLTDTTEGGKYRWLCGESKRNTSHLRTGELPVTFVRPNILVRRRPGIVEGTTFKPQIAADFLGQIVIGASGGQHAASSLQLQRYLETAVREIKGESVVDIYPDAGDILNRHVMYRWETLKNLLAAWGFGVKVAWWGQGSKESFDIDELSNGKSIRYLSWDTFLKVASRRLDNGSREREREKGGNIFSPPA